MEVKLIYQTIEDRENPDEIERLGPFECRHRTAWLGKGYYFWDTFIENAHWWGEKTYPNCYVICQANIVLTPQNCYDLVANTAHMLEFERIINLMKEKNLIVENKTTVSRVIEFLKKYAGFEYYAIRAYPLNSKSKEYYPSFNMIFRAGHRSYLDYKPPIQYCLLNPAKLKFQKYCIVYPEHYLEGYVI